LKKEKRGRRSAPYRPDPKISTAYYVAMVTWLVPSIVLKSTGRFIP